MNQVMDVTMKSLDYNSFILWYCPRWLLRPAIVYLTITWAIPFLTLWLPVWDVVVAWFWLYLVGGGVLWCGIVPVATLIRYWRMA